MDLSQDGATPNGSGPPPYQLDDQTKKAALVAGEFWLAQPPLVCLLVAELFVSVRLRPDRGIPERAATAGSADYARISWIGRPKSISSRLRPGTSRRRG